MMMTKGVVLMDCTTTTLNNNNWERCFLSIWSFYEYMYISLLHYSATSWYTYLLQETSLSHFTLKLLCVRIFLPDIIIGQFTFSGLSASLSGYPIMHSFILFHVKNISSPQVINIPIIWMINFKHCHAEIIQFDTTPRTFGNCLRKHL